MLVVCQNESVKNVESLTILDIVQVDVVCPRGEGAGTAGGGGVYPAVVRGALHVAGLHALLLLDVDGGPAVRADVLAARPAGGSSQTFHA